MSRRDVKPFGPPAYFYEGLRWHDGRWWASDMRGKAVYSFDTAGNARSELELDDKPSGLGWLPDGTFLVVSMDDQKVLCRRPDRSKFETFVDLRSLLSETPGFINDMVVTRRGHAYVGFDWDIQKYGFNPGHGDVVHIDPLGQTSIAARGISFPNGIVETPDGATLIVAETFEPQFTSFPIRSDGSLGDGSLWARIDVKNDKRPPGGPALTNNPARLDGCDIDREGYIWVADTQSACLRVAPGGDIVDAVFLPDALFPFACALGGKSGRELLISAADNDVQNRLSRKGGQLYITEVDVPGL